MQINLKELGETSVEVDVLNAYIAQYKSTLIKTQEECLLAKAKVIVLHKEVERLLKIEEETNKILEENKKLKEMLDNFEQQT